MLEWQSEASGITLRVRGKQWYWVYKLDLKDFFTATSNNLVVNNTTSSKWNNLLHSTNIVKYLSKSKLLTNNNFVVKKSSINFLPDLEYIFSSDFFFKKYKKNKIFFFKINNFPLTNLEKLTSTVKKNSINFKTNLFSNRSFLKKGSLVFTKNLNIDILQKSTKKINFKRHLILIQMKNDVWVKRYNNNFEFVNKVKNFENISDFNTSRLLKTNKILILPANFFINVITNSFDVIHSWFLPGLGFKMDCVPGRSTHHSLYVDVAGFYYGQCAEICGRLHHHMPIKVCFLDYDHFSVWYAHSSNNVNFLKKIKF